MRATHSGTFVIVSVEGSTFQGDKHLWHVGQDKVRLTRSSSSSTPATKVVTEYIIVIICHILMPLLRFPSWHANGMFRAHRALTSGPLPSPSGGGGPCVSRSCLDNGASGQTHSCTQAREDASLQGAEDVFHMFGLVRKG